MIKKTTRPIMIMLLSIGTSMLISYTHYEYTNQQNLHELDLHADEMHQNVMRRFGNYEQILFGARGLFLSSPDVKFSDWTQYLASQDLDVRFRGISAISYVQNVKDDDLDSHVKKMQQMFPSYSAQTQSNLDEHYLISYVFPLTENSKVILGIDNAAEQSRAFASHTARDLGKTVLSPAVVLKQDQNSSKLSEIMFLPIYDKNSPQDTVEQRQNALVGFVTMSFHFSPLVDDVYGAGPDHLNMKIYDDTDGKHTLIYNRLDERPGTTYGNYKKIYNTDVFQRKWIFVFEDTRDSFLPVQSMTILGVGLAMSSVLYYLLMRNEKLQKESRHKRMETIGELSSRLAHDIRNPLAIISASIGILNSRLDDTTRESVKPHVERIERSVFRISHQINSVLDYVRTHKVEKKRVSLNEIVMNSIDSLIVPEGVKIHTSKKDIQLLCDETKMEIVFHNLLLNAIQAIGSSGSIEITGTETPKYFKIQIEDSGPGIPKEIISDIFEPLFTTKQSGTGIGLTSVKSIVDSHGGTISVTSPPTTFTILLPKS